MESKINNNIINEKDGISLEELKKYTTEELTNHLKAVFMTEEQIKKFNSFFYPEGYTNNLKPAEFCSVGIIEHISYFPLSSGSNYINTSDSLDKLGYTYWRRIKGDGNCYYRSVLINYLEILILTTFENLNPEIFFGLIKDIYFTEFPEKDKLTKKNTLSSLIHMYQVLVERYDINLCFDMLYRCYNKSDVIEKTLIKWLRLKLAHFLKENLDFEVNGFKLIQLIPGFELEDDLSYDKTKVTKYIDLELNRMNEFVEGYPLYITPLILDIDINIYYIEESGSYKAIPIDIKYTDTVKSQIIPVENYLHRFNGCKYSINTLFRVPHYDTIYTGEFIEDLMRNYNNTDTCLQFMAMEEYEYDNYLESVRQSANKARKDRNPLSSILNEEKKHNKGMLNMSVEEYNINEITTDTSRSYGCNVCQGEYKLSNMIATACDDRICTTCFEKHINTELNKCKNKGNKLAVGESPSDKIIEAFKLFKIKSVRCFNSKCHIQMQYNELKDILDSYFSGRKDRKDDKSNGASAKEKRYCKLCTRETQHAIMIHGCLVCAHCQRHSIKVENDGRVVVLTNKGTTRKNKCLGCYKPMVEFDDMGSLFTKSELERGYIN
jgi:hypothetical protein